MIKRTLLSLFVLSFHLSGYCEVLGFKMPSGNIACALGTIFDGRKGLACTMLQVNKLPSYQPGRCKGEYGKLFFLPTSGEAHIACGTADFDGDEVLEYGSFWKDSGIECESTKAGVICKNKTSNGFKLSRANQRIF